MMRLPTHAPLYASRCPSSASRLYPFDSLPLSLQTGLKTTNSSKSIPYIFILPPMFSILKPQFLPTLWHEILANPLPLPAPSPRRQVLPQRPARLSWNPSFRIRLPPRGPIQTPHKLLTGLWSPDLVSVGGDIAFCRPGVNLESSPSPEYSPNLSPSAHTHTPCPGLGHRDPPVSHHSHLLAGVGSASRPGWVGTVCIVTAPPASPTLACA